MVEWIIGGILFLILIFLIYCIRLLVSNIKMKSDLRNGSKLHYDDAEFEYLHHKGRRKNGHETINEFPTPP
jgi:hypothetical protein